MDIFPAIDLKQGHCVRLQQGRYDKVKIYHHDPKTQAQIFADTGCHWLHVIDLDGAAQGTTMNGKAVEDIINSTHLNIQLGGGIRNLDSIRYWLERGVKRVILGTLAMHYPDTALNAMMRFPHQIAISLDTKQGKLATQGWL